MKMPSTPIAQLQPLTARPWRRLALALLCLLVLMPSGVQAQASASPPERMAYQGFLTDGAAVPLGNSAPKNYDIIFRIWNDPAASGAANRLWAEQQTVTVDKGYFSVMLGEGGPYSSEPHGTLSAVFAAADASDRYVEFTVRGIGTGGADVTIQPRLRLLASPYAFLAKSAGKIVSSAGTDLVTSSGNAVNVTGNLSLIGSLNLNGTLAGNGAGLTNLPNIDASKIIGVLGTAQIPSLDASKITSGVFAKAQIPNLDASNITSGSFIVPGIELQSFARIDGTHYLELGYGVAGKAPGAGQIGYGTYTANTLDIVGGGTNTTSNRKVKIWAESGTVFTGGIQVRGGAPGANGTNNNGYAFIGNSGDPDSGMFNTAAGQVEFYANGIERMRIAGSRVGINTTSPRAPLDVTGSAPYTENDVQLGEIDFFDGFGYDGTAGSSFSNLFSIVADQYVGAMGYVATSDRRIKKEITTSSREKDLAAIQQLRVAEYRMVDTISHGAARRKGFIAQEVEKVIPGAVSQSVNFIPDIFALATNVSYAAPAKTLTLSLSKAHDLKVGERVRLHLDNDRRDLNVAKVLSPYEFVVEGCEQSPRKVFVYGREVSDFRTVDYDHIFTVGVGAIQELARRVDAQSAELADLRAELAKLRAEKKTLAEAVADSETREQARDARLARLELALKDARGEARAKDKSETGTREASSLTK